MSERHHSHHRRDSTDRRDRSPAYIMSRHTDERNGRERSCSPRRGSIHEDRSNVTRSHGDRGRVREQRRYRSVDRDNEQREGSHQESQRGEGRIDRDRAPRQSCLRSPDSRPEKDEQGHHTRRSSSMSSASSSRHRSKRHRHRRHRDRSRSPDGRDGKSTHSSSSQSKDKHRSSHKKHKDRYKDEKRSVLTGKKIKLKVHKDAADYERDANRESLLQYLNSAFE